jgi:abhydrolase domain-containing protein 1/3
MNNRGLGGVPIKTPRLFCATKVSDLNEVINHVRIKHPNARLMGLGTSLGGMLLCKYLVETPKDQLKKTFEAVLVISTCWDAVNGVTNLEKPLNQVINYGVVSNLQYLTSKYRDVLEPHHTNFDKIMTCRRLRDFDTSFTAPHFGYASASDYYKDAQVVKNVYRVGIPVFGLNALDDPFSPEEDLPLKEADSEGSKLAMIITDRGGHLGFLEGNSPFRRPFHFMERVVNEVVDAVRLYGHELREID